MSELKIAYNTTWDDVERFVRTCDDEALRQVVSMASEEIADRDCTIEEFYEVIADSQWANFEDVVNELTDFADFMKIGEWSTVEEFHEHYTQLVMEHGFLKMVTS